MLLAISDLYFKYNVNEVTQILISLCVMMLAGFLVTRITKRLKLPNVTGFIIAGILIGPSVLGVVPENIIGGMGFISDIAMTFIAFAVGKFFTTQVLKKDGKKVLKITLFEVVITAVLMILMLKLTFNLEWSVTLILAVLSIATAPASTMMIINQYKAKGSYVETLLQVIAYGNVICLFLFGIMSSIINATSIGYIGAWDIILPIVYNLGSMLLGFIFGIILGKLLAVKTRSSDNRLILLVAMLLALAGICSLFDISAHIACMIFGATYVNYTKDNNLYSELNKFTPPIMSVFFVLGGMNLSLSSLGVVGLVGVVYTLARLVGKYTGTFVGCMVAKTPPVYKKYLGLSLVPQAGVTIGLAFLAQRILPLELGNTVMTIILASSVLYELIGPACAKTSLVLAGAIPKENNEKQSVKDDEVEQIEVDNITEEIIVKENVSDSVQQDILGETISDVGDNIEE